MTIPLNTWLMHRHSLNIFKVVKINALNVEVIDEYKTKGYANRDLLEQDLNRHVYIIDRR